MEKNCQIGDKDTWSDGISNEFPQFISLECIKDEYYLETLSLQEEKVHIGVLNREAVESMWSMQTLDLLFFTNDDDER